MESLSELERAQLLAQKFKNNISSVLLGESILNISKIQVDFATKVVANLYENIIYKEDFEIKDEDKASVRFARRFVTEGIAHKVCSSILGKTPCNMTESLISESAESAAKNLTKIWVEDAKFQMNEIEVYAESNSLKELPVSEKFLVERFSFFREFDRLKNMTKTADGDVGVALISEMDNKEKMLLAVKINAFKGALGAIGFDTKDQKLSEAIYEEFNKNLFL